MAVTIESQIHVFPQWHSFLVSRTLLDNGTWHRPRMRLKDEHYCSREPSK